MKTLAKVDCRKVCYDNLTNQCIGCPKCTLVCATKHSKYINDLSYLDKLVLEGIMGEQEEFDDGTGANELLKDYLEEKVQITISSLTYKDAKGKKYQGHIVNAVYPTIAEGDAE